MRKSFTILLAILSSQIFAKSELTPEQVKFIAFWEGTNPQMTLHQLASYCAPIFWYSPDEPELENKEGKDINIPASFPFQGDSEVPIVYYQIR